jgi:2-(1,2-epoxy-1,2-dihydrophenyl)acetyl-CoA isomerase
VGYETILFEREGGVATITLNRPEAMNSLTVELAKELAEVVTICEYDPDIRAVVLTANGRAFCAGADVKLLVSRLGDGIAPFLYQLADDMHEHVVVPIRRMAKPVIAAVNGVAAGGGLGLALCCDLRIAAAEARLTVAYSNIAVSPDCSTSFFLPRLVGTAKAMELYLFNDVLSAEQAMNLGLVNRVVPGAELAASVREMATRLAAGPGFAYAQTKHLLNRSLANDLSGQLEDEARAIGLCAATDDHRNGLEAFVAKQKPQFVGH